jgi:hypothetical protein
VTKTPNLALIAQSKPVPMRVAASLVYHQLNHGVANLPDRDFTAAMNSTALALSQVADVYYVRRGKLLRLPSEELARGAFENSGETYRTPAGNVYRTVCMRRIDVMEAIVILRKARQTIERARVS